MSLHSEKNDRYIMSLNHELHSIMAADPRIVIIGEDIVDPYGGAFKVTKGLSTRFPERVFTSPISESAIVGTAIGLSMRGFYPVVEIMFGDFIMLAADQIINHAAKFRWIYNNKVNVPIVVRTPMGGRRGYGPTHSQSLEKHFIGIPDLWVVAPNIVGNPGKLLRQAILDCNNPLLFIEDKSCYGKHLITEISNLCIENYHDDTAPFPSSFIYHDNIETRPDGLLFCYGGMVSLCIEVIEYLRDREGLHINLIVLTQLSPIPWTHIRRVLDKWFPRHFFYAEEANAIGGWSSEIITTVEEIRGSYSQSPHVKHARIGAKDTPIPASRELELNSLPQVDNIVELILNCF